MSINLDPQTSPESVSGLIETQGFSVVADFVDPQFAIKMRDVLGELIEEDERLLGKNPFYRDSWMVMNLMYRHPLFIDFLNTAPLRKYAAGTLGETSILYSFTSSSMPPSKSNFSNRIHADSPRLINGYPTNMGFIIPLTDFTGNNGATQLLPGSHTERDQPSIERFNSEAIEAHLSVGQALVFNARLWHRGGTNTSHEPRHALTINMCRSFMRQHFDFSRMVTDEFLASANEEAMALIGWNVRMPSSLDEYYVSEADRFYKAGQG